MRTLLLTALLLTAPPAHAQTTAPAPAPSATTAAAAAAAAATLNLTAPVGTLAEFVTTTRTRLTLEDVQLTRADGTAVEGEERDELRRTVEQGLAAAGTQVQTGKAFVKVQERAQDGTLTLLNTVVTPLPGRGPLSVRTVQTVAPDGAVEITRLESDDPLVQSALAGLPREALRAQASQNGGTLLGLYGRAFAVGQPVTQQTTVDAQALLSGVFGSLAAGLGAGQNALGQVQASPLSVTTTTTYRGVNPAGQRAFATRSTFGTWTVELGGGEGGALPQLRLELRGGVQDGLSLYRPDGLPAGQTQTQTLRMNVGVSLPSGERITMLARLEQSVTLRPR